jgi:hemoglobin
MIVEYIRYRVDGERGDDLLSAYATAAAVLEADPRCLSYEVGRGVEEPDRVVVRIEWTSIEDHLRGFRTSPGFAEFFAAVRPFFDDIEEMKHYEVRGSFRREATPDVPSLYDWAGGTEAFRRLIDAFYDRVEADDLLSGLFPGGVTQEHRDAVTRWWSEVFGGPAEYSAQGGYPRMLRHHRDLAITADQRRRFATLMSVAADDAELPADPEFRAAFVSYVEWGTRLAMSNSQHGADVVPDAPVPHWGWGVAPPYLG